MTMNKQMVAYPPLRARRHKLQISKGRDLVADTPLTHILYSKCKGVYLFVEGRGSRVEGSMSRVEGNIFSIFFN